MSRYGDTLEFMARLQRSLTVDQVCDHLLRVTSRYGLTRVLAGSVSSAAGSARGGDADIILSRWPQEGPPPQDAPDGADREAGMLRAARRGFEEAESMHGRSGGPGLREAPGSQVRGQGMSFPIMTIEETLVVVLLGGRHGGISRRMFGMTVLVATYAVGRALQIRSAAAAPAGRPRLTSRETECMRWAALGKSEWEISQILGISEHTSEKHLLSAKSKLGAANRVQAVAEAIRHGYIS